MIGEPVIPGDAGAGEQDPYQFQWWTLGLVGARPTEQKKGADKGIDGRIFSTTRSRRQDETDDLSVKAGNTIPRPRPSRRDRAGKGGNRRRAHHGAANQANARRGDGVRATHTSPWGKHPRLQILTIEQLLGGKQIDYPH